MTKPEFKVMAEPCAQCLFTKDRIVEGERAAEIISQCREEGTHFICHKATLAGGQNVCCRRFYDTQETAVVVLAKALGVVKFVNESDLGGASGSHG